MGPFRVMTDMRLRLVICGVALGALGVLFGDEAGAGQIALFVVAAVMLLAGLIGYSTRD